MAEPEVIRINDEIELCFYRCLYCGAPTDSYLCDECQWYEDRWFDEDFLDEEEALLSLNKQGGI